MAKKRWEIVLLKGFRGYGFIQGAYDRKGDALEHANTLEFADNPDRAPMYIMVGQVTRYPLEEIAEEEEEN